MPSQLLSQFVKRLRRAAAAARMFWHEVEIDVASDAATRATCTEDRRHYLRRLVTQRGKLSMARADYQATFAPGERRTWSDA